MTVSKYRSAIAMPRPARTTGPDLVLRIRALWNRAFLLAPAEPPRGVQRFRSIDDANQARARATIERMKRRRRTRIPSDAGRRSGR